MKISVITAAIVNAAIKAKASPDPFQDCWIIPFNDTPWPIAFVFNPQTQDAVIINVRTKKAIKLNGSPASEYMKTTLMDHLVPTVGKNWLKQNPAIAKKLKAATELTDPLMSEVIKSVQSVINPKYTVAAGRITVPASLATVVKKVTVVEVDPNLPQEAIEGFFVLGYWANPYQSSDKEYYWSGPFASRANAVKYGKRRQENGQPKRFHDWMKGSNSVIQGWPKFKATANKVGINPSDAEIGYYQDM
ncbi:hypothetical protein [Yersinia ruckeri]|uniref:hypothetical protein n=1 Tax=Yersinia ruckeri TaxID=29486 RepID=UPI002238453C|nr:hypothetical protein [Yersinia ruckeri]MCW6598868.1 hypothetical protein [Yersinia ruckeri]